MSNPYRDYYITQAGTGISGFAGVRYQKGHGFFGRLLSKAVFPLMRFLGKKATSVGANIASDVLLNKKDWRESAKDRLVEGGKDIANAGLDRAKQFIVEGRGRKRPRKSIKRLKTKRLAIENLMRDG